MALNLELKLFLGCCAVAVDDKLDEAEDKEDKWSSEELVVEELSSSKPSEDLLLFLQIFL